MVENPRDLESQYQNPTTVSPNVENEITHHPDHTDTEIVARILPKEHPLTRLERYELFDFLGEGSMGAVYLAYDRQQICPVALKIPKFRSEDSPHLCDQFLRAAQAASKLEHPNLCQVLDWGTIEGVAYLSMTFLEGNPLSQLLSNDELPGQFLAASLVRKLASGLAEAHRQQVVHRDIKPRNIMITAQGEPVIMDFGLAHLLSTTDSHFTSFEHEGKIVGTPAYMSPEQVTACRDSATIQTDVYSLGVLLYQLLTGRLPFEGPLTKLFRKILSEPPIPPSIFEPTLAPQLEAICLRMMAKKPLDRFRDMNMVIKQLTNFLTRQFRID